MRRLTLAAGAVALAASTVAQAQEIADLGGTTALDTILVTDGLTPVEQEKSGRAFTVIRGEDLQRNQVRYVADALRQVPGFAVSRTGSHGGLTQIRVRGAEANHLLVLVDGVEVSETSGGEFDFSSLLVDEIDRIEVLSGPQSTFFGSNALAGVVNIITRRGERGGWSVRTRSEGGTDGTFLGGVAVSGGGENYDVALSGLFRRNDGFNVSDFGNEKDGDRNVTLNGRFSIDLTPELTVDGTLRYVNRRSDTDPQDFNWGSPTYGMVVDGDDETATREFFGSIGATHVALDGALTQKLRFTGNDTFREYFDRGAVTSWNDGNRYNASYQATYAFETPGFLNALHQVSGGYEWERESFRPSHLTETFSRATHALIGEYRGEYLDQFDLKLGARHDFNSRFGDATTYSAAASWRVPASQTRIHASVGTGVTNPTFFEQFGYIPATFRGNPNLVPETSFGWDFGVEQKLFDGMLVVDVTYFNQNLRNEIATVYDASFVSSPVNRSGVSRRQGIEVGATLDLFNGFTANASYTYLHATEQTVAGGPRLTEVRRPRHSGSLGVAYTFYEGRARVFADAVFNGTAIDLAFIPTLPPRITLPAYTVVNIGGSFRFNDSFEVYGRVENLFDQKYEEVFGYNSAGRTAFVGLKGTF